MVATRSALTGPDANRFHSHGFRIDEASAMFIIRFLAVSIAVILGAEPNSAASSTVRDVVKSCLSEIDSPDYSYCLGVMEGAEDMAIAATGSELLQHSADLSLGICFSHPEPDPGELADVFVAWAKANVAASNWDESLGLIAAFREKWPCGPISH